MNRTISPRKGLMWNFEQLEMLCSHRNAAHCGDCYNRYAEKCKNWSGLLRDCGKNFTERLPASHLPTFQVPRRKEARETRSPREHVIAELWLKGLFRVVHLEELVAPVNPAINGRMLTSVSIFDDAPMEPGEHLVCASSLQKTAQDRNAETIKSLAIDDVLGEGVACLAIDYVDILNNEDDVPTQLSGVKKPVDDSGAALIIPRPRIEPSPALIEN